MNTVKAIWHAYPRCITTAAFASASIALNLLVDWLNVVHVLPLHIH